MFDGCISRLVRGLFLFSSSRAEKILLSFPTRRSSDLNAAAGGCKLSASGAAGSVSGTVAAATAATVPDTDPATPEADRKSTRLNSSHTVISYAVFCLKKKKLINRPRIKQDNHIIAQEP